MAAFLLEGAECADTGGQHDSAVWPCCCTGVPGKPRSEFVRKASLQAVRSEWLHPCDSRVSNA